MVYGMVTAPTLKKYYFLMSRWYIIHDCKNSEVMNPTSKYTYWGYNEESMKPTSMTL